MKGLTDANLITATTKEGQLIMINLDHVVMIRVEATGCIVVEYASTPGREYVFRLTGLDGLSRLVATAGLV